MVVVVPEFETDTLFGATVAGGSVVVVAGGSVVVVVGTGATVTVIDDDVEAW